MRTIKYRQAVYKSDGSFSHYHYWGWTPVGCFVSPMDMSKNVKGQRGFQCVGLNDHNGDEVYHKSFIKDVDTNLVCSVEYGKFSCRTSVGFGWYLKKHNGKTYVALPTNLEDWELVPEDVIVGGTLKPENNK